ncbi:MAG: SBBP repeat-containing protein [Bryobacteraceae bacterium]
MGLAVACMALTSPPRTDYVSYLGGSYSENAAGIAVDATGAAYVAGNTSSPDFPLTSIVLGAPDGKNGCAFVTKFNPAGTGIAMSICVAKSRALAFGLDAGGNMYLALNRGGQWFNSWVVEKLDPSGQNILYSTPIGAAPESMAVDATGNVYIAGAAGADLGATPGAYQKQLAAGTCPAGAGEQLGPAPCPDAFVMKLGTSGAIGWATYLGGSGPDDAHAVAIDRAGNVWVTGETVSPDFPVIPGAVQSSFHGEVDLGPLRFGDAFVSKLDPTGGKLLFSTYLGGSAPDGSFGIAIDAAGSAYIAGGTQSSDFPTTAGTLQPTYSGAPNAMPSLLGAAFVAKFSSTGQLVYSTFLGASNQRATAIAADSTGGVFVNAAPQASNAVAPPCSQPAAVSAINPTGSAIEGFSPAGGDYLALDGSGGLYSAGLTRTLVFLATPHAYQTQYGGGDSDAFAAKVDFSQPAESRIFSVVNAASLFPGYPSNFATGAVAPGEIVTLFGNGFGPQPSVLFNGAPAPVLYASNCQINSVVPFGAAPGFATFVDVQAGETVGPVKLPVVAAAPGIFTTNGTGSGQAAVVNQDGTPNSSSNPAPLGSIVAVYMTGAGRLVPFLVDGATGPLSPPFPMAAEGIGAKIGSLTAAVTFAGQAPGLIAGVTQVNVQIPETAPTGDAVPLTIFAGGYESQFNPAVTLAVR